MLRGQAKSARIRALIAERGGGAERNEFVKIREENPSGVHVKEDLTKTLVLEGTICQQLK